MLSHRRRRQAGSVFAGLLLYQSLFMAVGACAQAHDSGHTVDHGVAEAAGQVERHGTSGDNGIVDRGHVAHGTEAPNTPTDRSDVCCDDHAARGLVDTTDAVSSASQEGPPSSGQNCTALSTCGTPAVDGARGADGRVAAGQAFSAIRPASLAPTAFDLLITPPPPKA